MAFPTGGQERKIIKRYQISSGKETSITKGTKKGQKSIKRDKNL